MSTRDSVVLVDPVLNGAPFKAACADRGLDVLGVYTIDRAVVTAMDPTHAAGDARSVYGRDPAVGGRPAAVVPATEPGVLTAARLAGRHGLPGQPPALAPALRDKRLMRRHARARGVRVPRFTTAADGLGDALRHTGLPAIVKPTGGAGAHNVFLVREPADLERVARADRHDLFGGAIDEWLVEEYVRGREFAVNTFTVDGGHTVLDVWEYRQPGPGDYDNPYWDFVQIGADVPGHATVARFAQQVLDAFEIALGPAHIEIKLPADGDPVLIELGARLPGAGIPSQWERHSALRPYADTLAVHLGEPPSTLEPGFDARLGMCFIRHDGPAGILHAVHGLDAVRTWTGVEGVTAAPPGGPVGTTTALGAEIAKVRLAAPDDTRLAALIARVRAAVHVEVVERAASAA
ncbi:ATP-grasp domain-containing protein [Pseudonocardia sp. WMMC193]|uniref:ATP-grasp domain-containing protein n=1 Tax=Pseudonocardia sp. WMMC193 TaxID=2911965 RepID=UPI001F35A7AA|nr:ATP-grasp domain-containing protein [Pseudonocardia sp. WMMC193]MCF7551759.1 ATP-grasp domain-containing protein [Pseudonocardia sp. WMMC193]